MTNEGTTLSPYRRPGEVANMRRTVVAAAVAALVAPPLAVGPARAEDLAAAGHPTTPVNPLIGTASGGRRPPGARLPALDGCRPPGGAPAAPAGRPPTRPAPPPTSGGGARAATGGGGAARGAASGAGTGANSCGDTGAETRRSYYTLHCRAEFAPPFSATGTWTDGTVAPG